MAPSPAVTAIVGDTLWCLGLGCLLGAGRGVWSLLFGDGALRRFVGDLLCFAAAAVLLSGFAALASAGGLSRWYMGAAMAVGAACWLGTLHRVAEALLACLLKLLAWPCLAVRRHLILPLANALCRRKERRNLKKSKKMQEKAIKRAKKQLPNASKILYN